MPGIYIAGRKQFHFEVHYIICREIIRGDGEGIYLNTTTVATSKQS